MHFLWRSARLRADLHPVEPKPGSSGTPGLRQSGMVFFLLQPGTHSSAREARLGNVTGLLSFVPRCGTGALRFQFLGFKQSNFPESS